ncbi:hypothetical protein Tco_1363833, partial [Tanacetum coccineum]
MVDQLFILESFCISEMMFEQIAALDATGPVAAAGLTVAEVGATVAGVMTVEKVRIMQKSQENGQTRANTNTRMERVHKSREFDSKK